MRKMQKKKIVNLAQPVLGDDEFELVKKVLKSGFIAQGKIVEKFENKFAKYIGVKYAVATANGTSALHLSLIALGIGKEDKVITTPLSFISTANAIVHARANPVFVDVDEKSYNINPDLIERNITKRTKAIIPVHLFGMPSKMDEINSIAKKYSLRVIEDACQGHGAKYKGRMVGSLGDLACFSFYATKNITCGEGGIVTTNSKGLSDKIKMLRNHGIKDGDFKILGYNMRMTDIQAALGLAQLKKLTKFNKLRRKNAEYLNKHLSKVKGIVTPSDTKYTTSSYHHYTIRITRDFPVNRDCLIAKLKENSITSGIYYKTPIHKTFLYKKMGYDLSLPVAERLSKEVL